MVPFKYTHSMLLFLIGFNVAGAVTISGNVRDASTRMGIDSAVVTFTAISGGAASAVTDSKGDYRITDAQNPTVSGLVTVIKPGYRPFKASVSNSSANPMYDIALIPAAGGAARLTGTITDKLTTNAVAGARVILFLDGYRSVLSPYAETVSGANGSYTFDSLLATGNFQYVITVLKPGFRTSFTSGVNAVNAQTQAMNISLTPAGGNIGTIKGKITGAADQAAVAGASVVLSSHENSRGEMAVRMDSVLTNPNGDFAFDSVPAGGYGYQLTVFAEGFITQNSAVFKVDSAMTVTRDMALSTVVVPNSVIRGSVTDSASSNAVAGAQVILRGRFGDWQAIDTTVTAANGSYSFAGLDAGEYSLVVGKADYRTVIQGSPLLIAVNPDTMTANVALSAVEKGTMAIFVEAGDSALGGALVSAVEKLAGGIGMTLSGTTSETGWVKFAAVNAGSYDVTVARTGYNTVTQSGRTVRPHGNDTTIVTLVRATGAAKVVKGAVKTSAGTGISGCAVTLTAQRPGGSILTLTGTSGAGGTFEIAGIPAGIGVAGLLFSKNGYYQKDTSGIALTADTVIVNVLVKPLTTGASGAALVTGSKKRIFRVYGVDGRLLATVAGKERVTMMNSLRGTLRTRQSVILQWTENGGAAQKKILVE